MPQEAPAGPLPGNSYTIFEVLVHTVLAGALVAVAGPRVADLYLYALIAAIAVASLVRLTSLTANAADGPSTAMRPTPQMLFGSMLYGITWGSAAAALPLVASEAPPELIVFLLAAVVIGILASFAGAGLRSASLLAVALPATVIPGLWAAYQQDWQNAALWGAIALTCALVSGAGEKMERLIGRLKFLSHSNTDLVKRLAVARDEALAGQRRLEELNESLNREIGERETAQQRLKASEQELSRILDDMIDTYIQVDAAGHIRRISPSVEFMLGHSAKECQGRDFSQLLSCPDDYGQLQQALETGFGVVHNLESRWRHAAGHDVWVSFNAHYRQDERGRRDGFEGIARDTTERRQAQEALSREKEWWRVTVQSIGDGVITTDLEGRVRFLNPVAEQKTGWRTAEAVGKPLAKVIWLVEESSREAVALPVDDWLTEAKEAGLANPAVLIHRNEDQEAVIELSGAPIRDSKGAVIGSVMVFRDVTKLRALATQLAYQATHDALTGLINRVEFDQRVEQAIHSANQSEKIHALLYIDLDQFKVVNDTCGHHAGDELLRQVTRLLRGALREADTLARLGGDEFGVLLTGCPLDVAEQIADKLRALAEEFRFGWEGEIFRIGASIGVVPITNAVTSLTELLSSADAACYVAKESGRNRVHVYKPDDKEILAHHGQMQWMQRIQQALEHDAFALHYQPITSIANSDTLYAEVLLRLIDSPGTDQERLVPPSAFLPAAERYHLMPAVDRWVISHAFRALSSERCPLAPDAAITINLSGQSLSDLSLYDHVTAELEAWGIDPRRLCFEITESAVIANMEIAQTFVGLLKEKGCKFALDDFGSGLSTFDYLKNLPVDYVKLDGLLVRELASSRISQAMVHAINYVAHVMGMQSIAEFVENEEILETLRKLKVDYAQGYGIAEPRPFYLAERRPGQHPPQ